MAKKGKTLEEKVQAEFPEFVATVERMQVPELNARLSEYAKHSDEVSEAKKDCEPLIQKRAEVAELAGPFNDAQKAIKMKSKYIIDLIKAKGGQ